MRWGAPQLVLMAAFLAACGGNTRRGFDSSDTSATSSSTGTTGMTLPPDAGPDALPDAEPDTGEDVAVDVVSDYVDPGCPDAEPPEPERECDPLASPTGCEPGLACYPFVDRPKGEGCDHETFGTACLEPGPSHAGDRCGSEFGWCAEGLLCVVGALSGARCLELCDPFSPDTCSDGLVCAAVDVEGYGVCG
jgi:hypothetical protein